MGWGDSFERGGVWYRNGHDLARRSRAWLGGLGIIWTGYISVGGGVGWR